MNKIFRYGDIIEWRWANEKNKAINPVWTSCYLIDGLLIDSGTPASTIELKAFLESFNEEKKIEKCIITHYHEDHSGGAKFLTEELGIPVYVHEKALKILRSGLKYPDYRQIAWGKELFPAPKVMPLPPTPIETKTQKYTFDLFPMPGHSPCLVSLIEKKQQWAFVTDGIVPKYKRLFGKNSDIQEDIREIYNSIIKLSEYTKGMNNLKIFMTGHEILQNGKKLLEEKVSELNDLHLRAHRLKKEGLSEKRILKKMFGDESIVSLYTKGDLSEMNLVKSLLKWPI